MGAGSGSTPMGATSSPRHAGPMTTSTLPPVLPADPSGVTSGVTPPAVAAGAPAATPQVSAAGAAPSSTTGPTRDTLDQAPLLALLVPLVLFAHGIVDWVDHLDELGRGDNLQALGGLAGLIAARREGALTVATGILLILAVAGFAWLTMALGARLRHLPVAAPAGLLAAFGAGATAAVWVGHLSGLLGPALPAALTWGGPALTAAALALVLVALTLEGSLPVGSLALAALAGTILLLPWGLVPLASLVLLIALGPVTRAPEPSP